MRYRWAGFISIILLGGAILWFINRPQIFQTENPDQSESFNTNGQVIGQEAVEYRVEEVARNLHVPWGLAFTSPNRMLVTERDGRVRVVENMILQEEPLITINDVTETGEAGLMGITLDPDYTNNRHFYTAYTYNSDRNLSLKVVKLRDNGDSAEVVATVIEGIPAAPNHSGSRVKFGPDGKLYMSAGDASEPRLSQNLDSPAGKILRLNPDGTIPEDNPFPNSPVFSYGHRNPQGFDWDPRNRILWETEHGPSGGDGPPGGDEVNMLFPGANYGWPLVSHENTSPGTENPQIVFTPAIAPASGIFYKSNVFPQFTNNFLFGALRGNAIWRVVVTDTVDPEVVRYESLGGIDYGRIREVAESPDGLIYFTTSNTDGRGTIREGDDKIYRLIPEQP